MSEIRRIGVIGAGAWGTTLGLMALRASTAALVWSREPEVAAEINSHHTNPFLPGIDLDPKLSATASLADLSGMDALMLVAPAQHLRSVCTELAHHVSNVPAVVCSKGMEAESGTLLSEVVTQTLPRAPLAVLSGPTFAAEVARGQPTAISLACHDDALSSALTAALGTPAFRPYASNDLIGAQVGGAVKNVLAIACGIVTGRKLGESARAAIMTRGMAEMLRLGQALGGEPETLMGLSGLGDLVLTCTSSQSRNMSLGVALGEGRALADLLTTRTSVAEGVATSAAVAILSHRLGVEMPISAAVNAVVNHSTGIDKSIQSLLGRPFRAESNPG